LWRKMSNTLFWLLWHTAWLVLVSECKLAVCIASITSPGITSLNNHGFCSFSLISRPNQIISMLAVEPFFASPAIFINDGKTST
jgi:hypothetical protein